MGIVSSFGMPVSYAGGLVGQNITGATINNSYYDTEITTLLENDAEVNNTAVESNSGILTCVGGFALLNS